MTCAWALGVLLAAAPPIGWQKLDSGLEYSAIPWLEKPAVGDGLLHVVRVDPAEAEVIAVLASERDGQARTAGAWAKSEGLAVAINLGMFADDHRANVGHLHHGDHVNQSAWHPGHQSVLALGPGATMFDLDQPSTRPALSKYHTVIQNLRILKGDGASVWKPNRKRWSEAAVGFDREGRLYFIFCRSPLEMSDFATRVAVTLSLAKAMHVEGGPEASLSIHDAGIELDLSGSYETGFNENDDNHTQWPIPNILGVRAKR